MPFVAKSDGNEEWEEQEGKREGKKKKPKGREELGGMAPQGRATDGTKQS